MARVGMKVRIRNSAIANGVVRFRLAGIVGVKSV